MHMFEAGSSRLRQVGWNSFIPASTASPKNIQCKTQQRSVRFLRPAPNPFNFVNQKRARTCSYVRLSRSLVWITTSLTVCSLFCQLPTSGMLTHHGKLRKLTRTESCSEMCSASLVIRYLWAVACWRFLANRSPRFLSSVSISARALHISGWASCDFGLVLLQEANPALDPLPSFGSDTGRTKCKTEALAAWIR